MESYYTINVIKAPLILMDMAVEEYFRLLGIPKGTMKERKERSLGSMDHCVRSIVPNTGIIVQFKLRFVSIARTHVTLTARGEDLFKVLCASFYEWLPRFRQCLAKGHDIGPPRTAWPEWIQSLSVDYASMERPRVISVVGGIDRLLDGIVPDSGCDESRVTNT